MKKDRVWKCGKTPLHKMPNPIINRDLRIGSSGYACHEVSKFMGVYEMKRESQESMATWRDLHIWKCD